MHCESRFKGVNYGFAESIFKMQCEVHKKTILFWGPGLFFACAYNMKWWLMVLKGGTKKNQLSNRMTHKNQRKDNEENTACCYISVNHKKAKHASKPYNPFSCCLLSFTFSEGHTNIFCFCWFWLLIRLCLWVKCGTSLLFVMLRS